MNEQNLHKTTRAPNAEKATDPLGTSTGINTSVSKTSDIHNTKRPTPAAGKEAVAAGPELRDAEFARKLGMRLQQLRWKKDLTQEVVAHLAGISTFTYQKFEKGESNPGTPMNPRLFTLLALADVFDMSLIELLDVGNNPNTAPQ